MTQWNKYVGMSVWHELCINKWPGWELNEKEEPEYVKFFIIHKKDKSSLEIASKWDDVCKGQFYYRDFTDDGLPCLREGEEYLTAFYFQLKEDYEKFKEVKNDL